MQAYLLRYGELTLKGRNRNRFIDALIAIIKPRLAVLGGRFKKQHKKLLVFSDAPPADVRRVLATVAGVSSISPMYRTSHDLNDIIELSWQLCGPYRGSGKTFAARAKRPNKRFAIPSTDLQLAVAHALFERGLDLKVDLRSPQITLEISVEVHETWCMVERWPGMGGLPIDRRSRHGLLLSGGLDSPVAGHLIQKRGGQLQAIYFHTPPYTQEGAKDKAIELASKLALYQNQMKLHIVNFTSIMKALVSECDERCLVVLSRRFMMRIAANIMGRERGHSLVTGESLGQVASQTIENIGVIGDGLPLPVLRPLIGMDKQEIIAIARRIGTYETSIQPFEDCCSLFSPQEPVTRVSLRRIHQMESGLDIQTMVCDAVAQTELLELTPDFRSI